MSDVEERGCENCGEIIEVDINLENPKENTIYKKVTFGNEPCIYKKLDFFCSFECLKEYEEKD